MTLKSMQQVVVLSTLTLLLGGCTEVEKFWDKEFVEVYAPGHMKEKDKTRLGESLNYFIGKSKDERIRVIGKPDACSKYETGEEACEWTPKSASAGQQHVVYTYNREGFARAWSYSGPLGQFTNADYLQAASKPVSSPQPATQVKKGWYHTSKGLDDSSNEFSREYFECQNKLAQDSKGSGMAMYEEYGIEKCMKDGGWVHR